MKKRILFLIVTVLLFSFSLAGCTTEFAMDRYYEYALLNDEDFSITYFAAEASELKTFAGIPKS